LVGSHADVLLFGLREAAIKDRRIKTSIQGRESIQFH